MSDEHNMKFGPAAFLSSVGLGKRVVEFQAEECFFTQGDPADSVFFLQRGRAKLAVISEKGKQATIHLLFPGDMFGEGALAAKPGARHVMAAAVYACTALKISREEMIRVLHNHPEFSDWFISYVVARGMRTQADLADHMFNSSEKRLARTLAGRPLASSRSTMQTTAATTMPASRAASMAVMVEAPVVQTSSTMTTRAPFAIEAFDAAAGAVGLLGFADEEAVDQRRSRVSRARARRWRWPRWRRWGRRPW
jgi:CRP-like cAMP-binding protein